VGVARDTRRIVTKEVARARSEAPRAIFGVVEPAGLERETPAADATSEPVAKIDEQPDLFFEPGAPHRREPFPVFLCRCGVIGQGREGSFDLLELQADLLSRSNERDPPENTTLVAALTPFGAFRLDEPAGLVEAKRGVRDAGAPGDFSDAQQLFCSRLDLNHC
jgi:hypothetical protein